MTPQRVYLAGPMSGMKDLNFPAFRHAARQLRAAGYDVVSPVEINPDPTASWHACMRRDIAALTTCDAICLLDCWQHSEGATLEHHIAKRLGLEIQLFERIALDLIALDWRTE
ncbi:MAG: DUF4406 domain-containing protein [Rhodoferax sp.]|nr:DUF4406 domain-containing protein [Rhodoferax sp.]